MENKSITTATPAPAEATPVNVTITGKKIALPILTAEEAKTATAEAVKKARKEFKESIIKAGRATFFTAQKTESNEYGKVTSRLFKSVQHIGYAEGDVLGFPSGNVDVNITVRFDTFMAGTEQAKTVKKHAITLSRKASHVDDVPADVNNPAHIAYFTDCKYLVTEIFRLTGFSDYIKVKEKHVKQVLHHAKRLDKGANDFARYADVMNALDAILYSVAMKLTAINVNDIQFTVAEQVAKIKEAEREARKQIALDAKKQIALAVEQATAPAPAEE